MRIDGTIRWALGAVVHVATLATLGAATGARPVTALAQMVVEAVPGRVVALAVGTVGAAAGPLAVAGTALGLVAAGTAASLVRPRLPPRARSRTGTVAGFAALAAADAAAFGLAGAGVPLALGAGVASVLPLAPLAFAPGGGPTDRARRSVLERTAAAGVALVAVGGIAAGVSRLRGGGATGRGPDQSLGAATAAAAAKVTTGRTAPGTAARSGTSADGEADGNDGPTGNGDGGGEMLDGTIGTVPVTVTRADPGGSFGFDFPGMPPAVTPVEDHYVVDKQLDNPDIAADEWTLTVGVGGATGGTAELSLSDLVGHEAARTRVATMVCVSNPVGGPLVSTVEWRGVPLRALLADVGVADDAVDVVTRAVDGYTESLPWAVVREREDVLVAYGMNGRTLARDNGFPARLLVPGRYGMKMTKWLDGVGAMATDHAGYWSDRGWDEEAPVRTLSSIRAARRRGDRVAVGGFAFAGTRGVDRVEVSLDGGETWHDADLEAPQSAVARRRWRYVTERPVGPLSAVVRATDGNGARQTARRSNTYPDGATGWHRATFEV